MSSSETPGEARFPLTNNPPLSSPAPAPAADSLRDEHARKRAFWRVVGRVFAAGFCLTLMLAGAILGNFSSRSPLFREFLGGLFSNPVEVLWKGDPLVNYTPDRQLPPEHQHAVNVLLLGIDRTYKTVRINGIKTTVVDESTRRSDAVLMARVDFDAETVSVLSVPRDTAVRIPGRRGLHRINAAYSLGGPGLARETVRDVFGFRPDYFVALDFDAFKKVVDAIGGVTLTVDKRLKYDDNYGNLHIDLQPGKQHLSGEQAMGYVRMRKDSSDMVRAQRQQAFLEAVRGQVGQPSTLLRIPDVLNAVSDNLQSDMTPMQMAALANFARKLPREKVQTATLPVVDGPKGGPSLVYVNHDEGVGMIRRLFYAGADVPVTINAPSRRTAQTENRGNRKRRRRVAQRTPPRTEESRPAPQDAAPTEEAAPAPETPESTPPPAESTGGGSSETPPPAGNGGAGRSTGDMTGAAVRDVLSDGAGVRG